MANKYNFNFFKKYDFYLVLLTIKMFEKYNFLIWSWYIFLSQVIKNR